jgi:hypothetical protein
LKDGRWMLFGQRVRRCINRGWVVIWPRFVSWSLLEQAVRKRAENIRKWAEGRPYFIVLVGVQAVAMVRHLSELYEIVDGRDAQIKLPPPPAVHEWRQLYRQHRRIAEGVAGVIMADCTPDEDTGPGLLEMCDELRAFGILSPEQRRECFEALPKDVLVERWMEGVKAGSELLEELFRSIEADIAGEYEQGILSREDAFAAICEPEFQFFYRVAFRCWIVYGEHPVKLLRRARSDIPGVAIDSIAKLVRLDRSILGEDRIAQHLLNAQTRGERYNLEEVGDAMSGDAKIESLRRLKVLLAALIWKLAKGMRKPIDVPEIRALFDAFAQDSGQGLRDSDLPEGDEAFYKAVQRQVPFWSIFPDPDKKGG